LKRSGLVSRLWACPESLSFLFATLKGEGFSSRLAASCAELRRGFAASRAESLWLSGSWFEVF